MSTTTTTTKDTRTKKISLLAKERPIDSKKEAVHDVRETETNTQKTNRVGLPSRPTLKRKAKEQAANNNSSINDNKPFKQSRLVCSAKLPSNDDSTAVATLPPLILRFRDYCTEHRTDLLPSLNKVVTSIQGNQKEIDRPMMGRIMKELAYEWGGGHVLGQVYRAVMAPAKETPPTKFTAKKETTICIDLTDEEDNAESQVETDEGNETENSKAAKKDILATAPEPPNCPDTKTAAALETLAMAASVVPAALPDPDIIELAIAYGCDLARRHGYTQMAPALWKEAARTIRFMSAQDRQGIWTDLVEQSKEQTKA